MPARTCARHRRCRLTGHEAGDITVNAAIAKAVSNTASLTLNAFHDVNLNANVLNTGGAVTVNAGGNLNLNAAGAVDVTLTGTNQQITAQGLNLNARDGRRATVVNTAGNQTITTGAGGVNLNVLNGAGVAQIFTNNAPAVGDQTVQTTGALSVVGGAAGGSTNSGIFQNTPAASRPSVRQRLVAGRSHRHQCRRIDLQLDRRPAGQRFRRHHHHRRRGRRQ